jgi:hypothetical protein
VGTHAGRALCMRVVLVQINDAPGIHTGDSQWGFAMGIRNGIGALGP